MSETKMFASLSSGLLARKGAAKPAMRPQGFGQMGSSLEDLGWNDMGHDREPAPAPSTEVPDEASATRRGLAAGLSPAGATAPVQAQVEELRSRLDAEQEPAAAPEPLPEPEAPQPAPVAILPVQPVRRPPPQSRAQPGAKGKSAFTLRLDPARHLKLRLACAVDGRSAQAVVTEALDQYLSSIPELEQIAGQVPATFRTRSKKG